VIYDKPYILVIDDDPDILDAIRAMLEDEGHHVQTSEKGDYAESLRDIAGGLPDLIVLDGLLSGKDGRAICQKLKEQGETCRIPVIMISAHPDAERSVKDVGADAFVAKPFSIDDFLDVVNRLLDRLPAEFDSP
jgi:DNA-binding response OmpR family regulator